jgi:hypothetical protein
MGGLKMLNIKMYIKGLKLSWIRRIIKKDFKITKLLLSSEKNIDITQLLNSGHKKQPKNPFWEEVFNAWRELQLKLQINELNINTCNIWNNENIKVEYQTVLYKCIRIGQKGVFT